MHDPIKYLIQQDFSERYVSFCVDKLKAKTQKWTDSNQFLSEINNIIGEDQHELAASPMSLFEWRYTYFYLVQNLLQSNRDGIVFDTTSLLARSVEQAKTFCVNHRITLGEEARELGIGGDGEPRKRKGSKTEKSLAIFTEIVGENASEEHIVEHRTAVIEAFMKELDMGRSGALTYFHSTKKRYIEK